MSVSFITCTGPWGFSSRGSMPCIAIDWEVDAARRMYGEALHSLRVRLGCEGVRSGGVLRFSVYDHCAFRVLCCMFHKQTDGHTTLAYAQWNTSATLLVNTQACAHARTHTSKVCYSNIASHATNLAWGKALIQYVSPSI